MSEAGYGTDGVWDATLFFPALDEGAVGSQAVALKVTAKGYIIFSADEDAIQAVVGAAGVPIIKNAVLRVMIGPELTKAGFSFARVKVAKWGFVYFNVIARANVSGNDVVKGLKEVGEMVVPVAHHGAA